MKKLSVLDLAFFLFESKDSPKHVAGLMKCKRPAGSPAGFVKELAAELKTHDRLTEPFNLVIRFLGLKGPHWEVCDDFSIDQHVFFHKPQKNMSWLEVQEFVAALHEPLMDRSKPLWEFHLVDGIEGGRFAMYVKLHHAYADGITMNTWFANSLSNSPDDMRLRPMWALRKRRRRKRREESFSIGKALRGSVEAVRDQAMATGGIAKLSAQVYLEGIGMTRKAVSLPFSASQETPLTGSATPGRSLATGCVDMERVKRLCKATRSTLNHVALACLDGALHAQLRDLGVKLDHPITIQMPVNLRKRGDAKGGGNKIGIVLVELADPTDDPYLRLREIGFTLRNVRNQIDGVPGPSISQYTLLAAGIGELVEKLKLSDRLPAHGHTLVSNVPGPREPLYVRGAQVEEMYPISTLPPGLRMNITLFSYARKLHFGIVATRDIGKLDGLAQHIEAEFDRLEDTVLNPR